MTTVWIWNQYKENKEPCGVYDSFEALKEDYLDKTYREGGKSILAQLRFWHYAKGKYINKYRECTGEDEKIIECPENYTEDKIKELIIQNCSKGNFEDFVMRCDEEYILELPVTHQRGKG